MTANHSLDEIRKKAHEINYELSEKGYEPREIEIIGYYVKRIAASYLSFFTHKEIAEAEEETGKISPMKVYKHHKDSIKITD